MNQCIFIGRMTTDVKAEYMPSGTVYARFSVALDRGKDKNGEDKGADFPSIVAFGKTAELIEKYSGKGLRIAVQCRVQTGSYTKDGVKHYTTDFVADRVEFLDWKNGDRNVQAVQGMAIPEGFQAVADEDIPF